MKDMEDFVKSLDLFDTMVDLRIIYTLGIGEVGKPRQRRIPSTLCVFIFRIHHSIQTSIALNIQSEKF